MLRAGVASASPKLSQGYARNERGIREEEVNAMPSTIAWLRDYESIAIWLEGIALVAIFFLDWREYRHQGRERERQEQDRLEQHKESAQQMEIWRKQIHAIAWRKSLRPCAHSTIS
jgi:hypothetical protein